MGVKLIFASVFYNECLIVKLHFLRDLKKNREI